LAGRLTSRSRSIESKVPAFSLAKTDFTGVIGCGVLSSSLADVASASWGEEGIRYTVSVSIALRCHRRLLVN
jgi:hypothetical protein